MKHRNAHNDCLDERNACLLSQYRQLCAQADVIIPSQIHAIIAASCAPRFWVSEWRAAIVLSDIFRGRPVLRSMRPNTRSMFQEIYSRACVMRQADPSASYFSMASAIVTQPAPSHYLSADSIRVILNRYRRELSLRRTSR